MNPRAVEDEQDPKDLETLAPHQTVQATHYEPATDEEKALDRRVNLKLDFIVLSLLAVEFIVSHADVWRPCEQRLIDDDDVVLRH